VLLICFSSCARVREGCQIDSSLILLHTYADAFAFLQLLVPDEPSTACTERNQPRPMLTPCCVVYSAWLMLSTVTVCLFVPWPWPSLVQQWQGDSSYELQCL